MNVNILGTEYTFEVKKKTAEETLLNEDADGLCEIYDKRIVVRPANEMGANTTAGSYYRYKHVVIHEVAHAFAQESGSSYEHDERLIDWMAEMIPHINLVVDQILFEQRANEEKDNGTETG